MFRLDVMTGITISVLAERAGVNTSAVRYYERAGLVPDPERAANGYRTYTPGHETRLLFITRARNLGLSIDQIAAMLGIWDGNNCTTTRTHLAALIDTNLDELAQRIADLEAFAAELRVARATLDDGPAACEPGLACCTPTMNTETSVTVTIGRRS